MKIKLIAFYQSDTIQTCENCGRAIKNIVVLDIDGQRRQWGPTCGQKGLDGKIRFANGGGKNTKALINEAKYLAGGPRVPNVTTDISRFVERNCSEASKQAISAVDDEANAGYRDLHKALKEHDAKFLNRPWMPREQWLASEEEKMEDYRRSAAGRPNAFSRFVERIRGSSNRRGEISQGTRQT